MLYWRRVPKRIFLQSKWCLFWLSSLRTMSWWRRLFWIWTSHQDLSSILRKSFEDCVADYGCIFVDYLFTLLNKWSINLYAIQNVLNLVRPYTLKPSTVQLPSYVKYDQLKAKTGSISIVSFRNFRVTSTGPNASLFTVIGYRLDMKNLFKTKYKIYQDSKRFWTTPYSYILVQLTIEYFHNPWMSEHPRTELWLSTNKTGN